MKPLVIFIDDEPNVLRGLKRLLRSEREKWDMVFLEGGEAAIDWLRHNNVDAIVTDMRMPDYDGADVLNFAAEHDKGFVRIVLSGEADRDLTYRTVPCSHQFLAKPCDSMHLVRAIETPFAFLSKLSTQDQVLIASALRELPCAADTIEKAKAALQGEVNLRDFAQIAAKDPGLSLRVFQLANSAYFGRPANTLSIYDAVKTISADVLTALLERGQFVDEVSMPTICNSLESVSQSAVSCARYLVELALDKGASEAEAEAAYSTALLSWTGEVLMSSAAVRQMQSSLEVNVLHVASYAACLLGIPAHMSATITSLARLNCDALGPEERALALAELMFDRAVA